MQKFTITEGHMALVKNVKFHCDSAYGEDDVVMVDPKRPYGNNYMHGDIAKAFGIKPHKDGEGYDRFTATQHREMDAIHQSMATVLQIFVETEQLSVGNYVHRSWDSQWEKDV